MFAAADQDWEIEEAYKSAQAVLGSLAGHSSQAAQYAEVLMSLYKAIIKQRQVLTSRNREKSGSMVGKVMSLPPPSPVFASGKTVESGAAPITSPENGWLHEFTFLDEADQPHVEDGALPWQNLSSQMWDNFLFDPVSPGRNVLHNSRQSRT